MAESSVSPLAGKTVVITRAVSQSAQLSEELTARGARVISLPLVSFAPPEDYDRLDAALSRMESFDWIIFTSANAVQAVQSRNQALGRSPNRAQKTPRVAVVGPATAEAAEKSGFSVDYTASIHSGIALADELGEQVRNHSVFLPRSDRANPDLPQALRRNGANVTEVIAYRTLPPSGGERANINESLSGGVDGILFFSPSAAQSFVELVDPQRLESLQGRAVMVAVGPVTAEALRAAGLQRIAWAADTTTKAIVEALEGHLSRTKRSIAGVKQG
jgi:uroporphyrinogen-III synthase